MMIPQGVEIYVSTLPVDMRFGFERLGGIVREQMKREPKSRALFVFFGRRRQTVKILWWDGTGVVLIYRCQGTALRIASGTAKRIRCSGAPGSTSSSSWTRQAGDGQTDRDMGT